LLEENLAFFLILNAYWEPLHFEVPQSQNARPVRWYRWIDTFLPSPNDIVPWDQPEALVSGLTYPAGPRSVVALLRHL
jgi:isoamylase